MGALTQTQVMRAAMVGHLSLATLLFLMAVDQVLTEHPTMVLEQEVTLPTMQEP
jgi:hypothetical protein